jgi:hypothetical protein
MTTSFKPEVLAPVAPDPVLQVDSSSRGSKDGSRDDANLDDIGLVDRDGPVVTRRELWSYYRALPVALSSIPVS